MYIIVYLHLPIRYRQPEPAPIATPVPSSIPPGSAVACCPMGPGQIFQPRPSVSWQRDGWTFGVVKNGWIMVNHGY